MERRISTLAELTWWLAVIDSECKRQLEIKDNSESMKKVIREG